MRQAFGEQLFFDAEGWREERYAKSSERKSKKCVSEKERKNSPSNLLGTQIYYTKF